MFMLVASLVIASVMLELALVQHVPLVAYVTRRSRAASVIVSVGISWALGKLFGATGSIVMIGAVVSSAVTQPIYAGLQHTAEAQASAKRTLKSLREALKTSEGLLRQWGDRSRVVLLHHAQALPTWVNRSRMACRGVWKLTREIYTRLSTFVNERRGS